MSSSAHEQIRKEIERFMLEQLPSCDLRCVEQSNLGNSWYLLCALKTPQRVRRCRS